MFQSLSYRGGNTHAITAAFAVTALDMTVAIAVAVTLAPETITDSIGGVEFRWLQGRRVGVLQIITREDAAIVDRACQDRHVRFRLSCFVGMLLPLTANAEEQDDGEEECANHGTNHNACNSASAER